MTKNILHNIEKNMSSFSKGQKLIARFILENYDKAAFMTASKLGKREQRCLVTAGTGTDLHDHILVIIRILGQ